MAVDMFLKIDGIPGESTKKKHENEIDIDSFSFGAHHHGSFHAGGKGGGGGKAEIRDISIQKRVDKSSPELFKACATGRHLKKAEITVQTASGDSGPLVYYTITMEDVRVSSLDNHGSAAGDTVMETVLFNTAKVKFDYQPMDEKNKKMGGVVTGTFDIRQNAAV